MKRIWVEILCLTIIDGLVISLWIAYYLENKLSGIGFMQWLAIWWSTICALLATIITIYNMRPRINRVGQYYFDKLPKSAQEKFLKNLKNGGISTEKYMKMIFKNKESFVSSAFIWRDTPEGHRYWEKISRK